MKRSCALARAIMSTAMVVAAAGCASTQHYGGKRFPVMVNVPAHSTVYMVPNTVWSQEDDGKKLFDSPAMNEKLELYRVRAPVTATTRPVETMVEAKTYTVVTVNGTGATGARRTQRYIPRMPHELFANEGP